MLGMMVGYVQTQVQAINPRYSFIQGCVALSSSLISPAKKRNILIKHRHDVISACVNSSAQEETKE